ncbi:MAG TPA: nicotinamide riboside transporter PnuC [Gammaproteobacteria bacterium]|jgi:nicotinamide mononucleotide transporter|nr:nicotinamide riboside transporter PnuC [Gammaproteobacteria bacterium]
MDLLAMAKALPPLEAAGVLLSIAYLVLAIRASIWCWPAAFVSSLLAVIVLAEARLYSESALNVFYAAMAVYGWYQWRYGGRGPGSGAVPLPISVWPWRAHALALLIIAAGGTAIGWTLHRYTAAAYPYADSWITVASIVTTYMVARKILENWPYWLVIDSASLYLYVQRGLNLYAALFALYLVLVVIGWYRWWRDWGAQREAAA